MATVVIVHAADDALPARALAEKLRSAAKLTVVLEKPPGEELRNAVKSAAVTIALWSPRSVTQADLADEVAFAKTKSKVVHALMQRAQPPEQFRNEKPVNLTGWRGEEDFQAWRDLAKLVADKAGVALAPPPPPRPPSGFFQPRRPAEAVAAAQAPQRAHAGASAGGGGGRQQSAARPPAPPRPAPAPRAAAQHAQAPRPEPRAAAGSRSNERSGGGGGARAIVIGLIAFVVIALAGGGGYWFWNQSQGAQAASAAWESVDRNDAEALRAFMAGQPGEFRDEAQAALDQLEERTYEAASDADTIEALEAFVADFPNSEHALVARGRIAELRSLPPEPAEGELETLDPTAPTDPDLVPPGATPNVSGGPATITPPPAEEPAPVEPGPDEPVN